MRLRDVLTDKGTEVFGISTGATIQEVVDKLVEKNCGSLLVMEDGQMVGIITERDVLNAASQFPDGMGSQRVVDCMTTRPITAGPDDEIGDTMGLMTESRIRHLPVTEDEQIIGIVSIGDIVKAQHDELTMENHYLKNYIQS